MIEIRRDIYLNRLIKRIGNGRAKVITGIRRCGKSHLLFSIFRNYLLSNGVDENHIIAISLDDDEKEHLLTGMPLDWKYAQESRMMGRTMYSLMKYRM